MDDHNDYLNTAILSFIRSTIERPLSPNTPTRAVMLALRIHLDETAPEWREWAFQPDGTTAVQVEFHLASGRVICGTLIQRPSDVSGEAA